MDDVKSVVQEKYGAAAQRVREGAGKASCCGTSACCSRFLPIASGRSIWIPRRNRRDCPCTL